MMGLVVDRVGPFDGRVGLGTPAQVVERVATPSSLALSPDGRVLALGDDDGSLRLVDAR